MKAYVILNPRANLGDAGKRIPAITQALAAAHLDYKLVVLHTRGQAKREAIMAAASNCDVVVAAGGDGTVHEVVNGLMAAAEYGSTRPLGILPLGTGNDLGDMVGIPRELTHAVQVVASGIIRKVDAGWASYDVRDSSPHSCGAWRGQFFDSNCVMAMEPFVSMKGDRLTPLPGNPRYFVAMLRSFLKLKARHMKVSWDGGCFEGPAFLLSLANPARTGGPFATTPGAQIVAGLFDFIFAQEMSIREMLQILPQLFHGVHVDHLKIISGRTRRLSVRSCPGTPVHVDGELLARAATAAYCQVLPGKISLCIS